LRRWDTSTDTNIGNVSKLRSNCGEENFAMGQDWQYMLGCYGSSLQNNDSWKMYYQTDTGVLNPAGLPPAVNAGYIFRSLWLERIIPFYTLFNTFFILIL